MAFFLENQGRVFSRDELLRRAWSKNIKAGHRTVDVHVRRLRQLLEPFECDSYIQTVRGFGYRFAQPAQPALKARAAVDARARCLELEHAPSARRNRDVQSTGYLTAWIAAGDRGSSVGIIAVSASDGDSGSGLPCASHSGIWTFIRNGPIVSTSWSQSTARSTCLPFSSQAVHAVQVDHVVPLRRSYDDRVMPAQVRARKPNIVVLASVRAGCVGRASFG